MVHAPQIDHAGGFLAAVAAPGTPEVDGRTRQGEELPDIPPDIAVQFPVCHS